MHKRLELGSFLTYLRMEVTQSDLGLGARLHTRLGFSGAGGFSVQSPEFGAVKCGDKWVKVMPYMRWYSRDTPARAPLMKSFKYNPHERAPFGWARKPTHSSTYRRLPFQDVGRNGIRICTYHKNVPKFFVDGVNVGSLLWQLRLATRSISHSKYLVIAGA